MPGAPALREDLTRGQIFSSKGFQMRRGKSHHRVVLDGVDDGLAEKGFSPLKAPHFSGLRFLV